MKAWGLRASPLRVGERVTARRLLAHERALALDYLSADAQSNLLLLNAVRNLDVPPLPGEAHTDVVAVWSGDEILGVALLRPILMLDGNFPEEAIEVIAPHFTRLRAGLLKCTPKLAEKLWAGLTLLGFEALMDRAESNYALLKSEAILAHSPSETIVRKACAADLDALVFAARGSLSEEGRPDPYDQDPEGFRAWVAGRLPNACVVEVQGEIGFVGFADVRQPEGWLLQGIYTWPAFRRRGYARAGVSELCRMAFAAGAAHVQLAVVSENAMAEALYRGVGFRRFEVLRTILFV